MTGRTTVELTVESLAPLPSIPQEILDKGYVTPAGFKCRDCKGDTYLFNEYYMVKDSVWPFPSKRFMLCIGCLQKRLHRPLTWEDFTKAPINNPHFKYCGGFSPRLSNILNCAPQGYFKTL